MVLTKGKYLHVGNHDEFIVAFAKYGSVKDIVRVLLVAFGEEQ
jgi:hypothetical protein